MILLDTPILLDILRKKARIITKMIEIEAHPLATCEICVMELYFGVYANKTYENNPSLINKRIAAINGLLKRLTIFNFSRTSAIKTAELMGKLKMNGNLCDRLGEKVNDDH